MKKSIFKSLIVGLVFVFFYYTYKIIRGMYDSSQYVPDIADSYESIDILQKETVFGIVINPIWVVVEILGLLLFGVIVFYIGSALKNGKKKGGV